FGANAFIEDGALRLVNGNRLPKDAVGYIRANSEAIVEMLLDAERDRIEERAAIIEFDAGTPREWAEAFAGFLTRTRPKGVDEIEWSWFISTCGRMIDEAPVRRAA